MIVSMKTHVWFNCYFRQVLHRPLWHFQLRHCPLGNADSASTCPCQRREEQQLHGHHVRYGTRYSSSQGCNNYILASKIQCCGTRPLLFNFSYVQFLLTSVSLQDCMYVVYMMQDMIDWTGDNIVSPIQVPFQPRSKTSLKQWNSSLTSKEVSVHTSLNTRNDLKSPRTID